MAITPIFTAPTTTWEDRRGNLILMQAPLKSELRLKKLVKISTTIGTMSSPVLTSSGKCRYKLTATSSMTSCFFYHILLPRIHWTTLWTWGIAYINMQEGSAFLYSLCFPWFWKGRRDIYRATVFPEAWKNIYSWSIFSLASSNHFVHADRLKPFMLQAIANQLSICL